MGHRSIRRIRLSGVDEPEVKKANGRGRANRKNRIWQKHGGRCHYCGVEESRDNFRTLDHVVPKSRGGHGRGNNLVPCCSACNIAKGDLSLEEFRAKVANGTPDFRFAFENGADHVDGA